MMPKHCFLGFLISFFLTGVAGTQPAHESLKPQRVQFQSRNFHNILQWQPGRALTGNSSVYFVQYKIMFLCNMKSSHQKPSGCWQHTSCNFPGCRTWAKYGQRQWKNKEDCWGTQELFCDLTSETSDIQEPYYGRVRAASAGSYSDWSMTPRFTPWWETKIDPPVMNITQVNGSLLVILHAPNLPHRYQKEKNISIEDYYELVYRVFIINNSLEKEQKVYEGAHRVVEIEALPPHSSYCVVAEIYQPMLDRRSQRSEERCVEIP
ncbi:PREDICTED: interleukin-22 receptor subunit alpha-2 isoform X3 [Cercocebus atys]|uniref:Interleukin-22 receptor subunit alpha-2 n=2 Tax=Cercopithecinae TaxID=9528 RepID=A0A2K5LLY9_CERAT|nr:PREDICTED: interleukin-22 receptor subunit alpha-2 isoform X1 [Mandrillus leucophaeus]XP_011946932.1 PREDICTED: interleukin-22 receptor subunit alpha-2 isoform X3 [Cercocebus atys]XP_025239410.1 interleukin-22 receptor subunit alpha-2 isoform X1 [Theropithecus gelada]